MVCLRGRGKSSMFRGGDAVSDQEQEKVVRRVEDEIIARIPSEGDG